MHPQLCGPCSAVRTRVSPSGARGSVIQEPNLDPDVLMVMGSLMPVSLPHAERRKAARWEHLQQIPVFFYVLRLIQISITRRFGFFFSIYLKIQKTLPEGRGSGCPACSYIPAFLFCARGAYYSHMFTHANACCTPSLWTCEEKKDRGTEKGGKPLRILLLCAACKLSWC